MNALMAAFTTHAAEVDRAALDLRDAFTSAAPAPSAPSRSPASTGRAAKHKIVMDGAEHARRAAGFDG